MTKFLKLGIAFCVVAFALAFSNTQKNKESIKDGAWQFKKGVDEYSFIAADGYCMVTHYSKENKKYYNSFGGPAMLEGNKLQIKIEFNSDDKTQVGTVKNFDWQIKGKEVMTNIAGSDGKWQRVDEGGKNLSGNWRITKRKQGEQMAEIPLRARRTLKLLTATRFQWAAINIETGEFSGTGGGTYTFKDGKYTENIEFFSRDSSRVGASLGFDAKLENGDWIHSGLSSKGDPIYEIWSRMK